MATETTEMLTRIIGGQDELKAGQTEIASALAAHSEILRLLAEQLSIVIEKLTPAPGDGPTMQELLAELVARVGDNGALLRRIDRRTDSMATSLPDDVVRAVRGAFGANGNGTAAGHGANGSVAP
ncbi:hypothetical protein [Acidisphaera sp. L21]|uniref:hypothetical protein n=1 Tax=Acidisphaera sp. L21 TaxID=1641851 RepID=UPI00131E38AA|nr:hypothetical protein [Acidisphaera sp. L21]